MAGKSRNTWSHPLGPAGPVLLWGVIVPLLSGCTATKSRPPPSFQFDLSHWKLTLPDREATEISPADLANGYASVYFFTAPDGALVFRVPAGGGTTKHSDYPRSELREVINPEDDNQNWTADGIHVLNATCTVAKTTAKQKIIVGQIHGFQARPLLKLQWEKGRMKALVKRYMKGDNEDLRYFFKSAPGNEPFHYQIKMQDGSLAITVNGETITHNVYATDPRWRDVGLYFKAGAYVQDNAGGDTEVGEVRFTKLTTFHQDYSTTINRE